VKAALEALVTVREVGVVFSAGVAACAAGGAVGVAVQFRSELGDLPPVTADAAGLSGGAGTVAVAETQKGDKDNAECSNRGVCNRKHGVCKCFPGWGASDHDGSAGVYRDCGRWIGVSSLSAGLTTLKLGSLA
jgi:hypothetical protein